MNIYAREIPQGILNRYPLFFHQAADRIWYEVKIDFLGQNYQGVRAATDRATLYEQIAQMARTKTVIKIRNSTLDHVGSKVSRTDFPDFKMLDPPPSENNEPARVRNYYTDEKKRALLKEVREQVDSGVSLRTAMIEVGIDNKSYYNWKNNGFLPEE